MAIEDVIAAQRAGLRRGIEDPLIARLRREYAVASARIRRRIDRLIERIDAARARGEEPLAALLQERRLEVLVQQIEIELGLTGHRSAEIIAQAQRVAIVASIRDVRTAGAALEVGVRLNVAATERITAAFARQSPLARLFASMPARSAATIRREMIQGVISGANPRVAARAIRKALDGNLHRAETIARTETLRAYRGATIESYAANRDLFRGWMWNAALDSRCCAMCVAMHGTTHPLDEPFASHPSCRCSASPWIGTVGPRITPGAVQFASWPEERQLVTLGPAKLAAYKAGRFELPDLVGTAVHPEWGLVRYERSLASILGAEARPFYRRAA